MSNRPGRENNIIKPITINLKYLFLRNWPKAIPPGIERRAKVNQKNCCISKTLNDWIKNDGIKTEIKVAVNNIKYRFWHEVPYKEKIPTIIKLLNIINPEMRTL